MESTFNESHLKRALNSKYEIIAFWGAYQILRLKSNQIKGFLSDFLLSPFPDIQDAGIAKIADLRATEHIPEILKIFRESDGQIKYSAALVLAQFPNDFSKSLIQKWFEALSASDQATRMEYEAATYTYLKIDKQTNYPKGVKALVQSQQDSIKSSVLFLNLLTFCETEVEYKMLLDQYFILRDLNSDAELTFQLIEYFGEPELINWWNDNLARGYSISSIYEQCFALLDIKNTISDRQFWSDIETGYYSQTQNKPGIPGNPFQFVHNLNKWVESLVHYSPNYYYYKWILNIFQKNSSSFLRTIPKIVEMESNFLLTIPLLILMDHSIESWLSKPIDFVENIANYYHSSLLISKYREQILNLFFPAAPKWDESDLKITNIDSPLDPDSREHEIIWLFYRGELLGYDIPWPSIFPNPDYSTHLAESLCQIYYTNFEYYIKKGDYVAIDYALQLFQLNPRKEFISLLITHFDFLVRYHSETFFQTIEYLPDPAFKPLLIDRYQSEEYELARLIFIICEIFDLDIPEMILDDLQKLQITDLENTNIKKPIRLHCENCNNTFQYTVDAVYVDEGSILRMNRLTAESVWVPQTFKCKKCSAVVPFKLDESQLNEFSLQSRVDRILSISPQATRSQIGQKIILIDFPRYRSKSYSPDSFEELIRTLEQSKDIDNGELQELRLKQARLYKSMRNWEACHTILRKISPLPEINDEVTFLKGLVNYKLDNYVEARRHFDVLVHSDIQDKGEGDPMPFSEQSKYYLKTMDSNNSKRSRFKVITGKK